MNEVSKLIDRTITEVEFDNTITSIGYCAFDSCSSLTSVTIPSWITSIDSYAFSDCSSLTSVTVLATTPPTLGSGVFSGSSCPIYVPVDSVSAYKAATNWGSYSSRIQGIPFLKAVYTDVNDVEHEVWGGDRTLARSEWGTNYGTVLSNMKSCEVKTGVTTIGSNCFYNNANCCPSLTSITLPDTVTTIHNDAFHNCVELTDLNIPSGVTVIDSYAFSGCAKLATDLSFIDGTGVKRLKNYVFAEMWYNDNGTYKGLTTANIPEGIITINNYAFYRSFCITSISIPSTVTSISSNALKTSYDYDNLVSMTVDANNATYDSRNNCNAVIHTSTNTLVAGCKTTVIPNTVTSIGSQAFGDVFLTSITIPDSVTSIGSNAFYSATLRNVTVQSTVPATISYPFDTRYISTIIVPAGTLSAYETAWSDYKDFLFENGVAKWVEQSYTCEVDANDTKTGMITVTEKDTNPTSSTYNQTRTRTYEDLVRCNPNPGFTKITSLADATSGTYLVVDETSGKALNASLIKTTTSTTSTGLNSSNNLIDVTITNDFIEADSTTLSAALEYDSTNQRLTWTDPDTTTTYFIDYYGSGVRFITNTTGTKYSNNPKEVNGRFTFGNNSRSLGKPSTTYIRWYDTSQNSQYFTGMALYKLS